ncbi:hypothetical protein Purlil1_12289 [Purpureocillium lilacinum]|uniref:Secreted protein n=1 Tax=Purpureocillium lilacinum TaxID=33203 RepID=A0ABR0BHH3_PURLI|nr:hypothetical protein Purlil1_12289 [Purpureocillium lilacinum]
MGCVALHGLSAGAWGANGRSTGSFPRWPVVRASSPPQKEATCATGFWNNNPFQSGGRSGVPQRSLWLSPLKAAVGASSTRLLCEAGRAIEGPWIPDAPSAAIHFLDASSCLLPHNPRTRATYSLRSVGVAVLFAAAR